ncbi:MAG: hypothetical protein M3069_03790 [Chloroflexota bacterium]|nr:hypothetical protein [Chloroflexota bacterium]
MSFEAAQKVADAVLFEGYLLYPYRASSQKNQVRWQFGVLMPPAYPDEASTAQTECLLEPGRNPTLQVRLRFLQVTPADGLDEGIPRELDLDVPLDSPEHSRPFEFPEPARLDQDVSDASPHGSTLPDAAGRAEVADQCPLVSGIVRIRAERLEGPYGVIKVRVRVENTSTWRAEPPDREDALRHALVGTHVLLGVRDGAFVSMIDPPEWAKPAVQACVNERTWPVLVGEPGQRDVMLSAPIILYDYPQIAPESQGDLFDATEIDEILTLRTMALTEDEKREARETDPRAAALVDRVDTMPGELLERLHGAVRYVRQAATARGEEQPSTPWWDPGADTTVSPETDAVVIRGQSISRGSRVKLTPGTRRADAHDMFLAGQAANVAGVFLDVDGERYLAVTLVDDPGADLYAAQGRYLYFRPDEVEPL